MPENSFKMYQNSIKCCYVSSVWLHSYNLFQLHADSNKAYYKRLKHANYSALTSLFKTRYTFECLQVNLGLGKWFSSSHFLIITCTLCLNYLQGYPFFGNKAYFYTSKLNTESLQLGPVNVNSGKISNIVNVAYSQVSIPCPSSTDWFVILRRSAYG